MNSASANLNEAQYENDSVATSVAVKPTSGSGFIGMAGFDSREVWRTASAVVQPLAQAIKKVKVISSPRLASLTARWTGCSVLVVDAGF